MQAVMIAEPGGPEVLTLAEIDTPQPAPGELLVRVHASGVNRADLLQRQGRYPPPPGAPANVPGLEYAGVVEGVGVGSAQRSWQAGDRVMGIVGGGAYAELLTVSAAHALSIPDEWSFEQAAAVPEAFITAHDALVGRAALRAGERVLVHAVGSGVGSALLQLAKLSGAVVAGTSRTPEKLERAKALGLDRAVLVRDRFSPDTAMKDWADVICDLVGGPYVQGNLEAVAQRGRIVLIGLTGGRTAEIDFGKLLSKRVTLVGTVLRSRPHDEKSGVISSFAEAVLPQFESGRLVPVVDRVFPIRAVKDAHRYMEENRNFGAIVLRWA